VNGKCENWNLQMQLNGWIVNIVGLSSELDVCSTLSCTSRRGEPQRAACLRLFAVIGTSLGAVHAAARFLALMKLQ
jgi:hypothetical protein